jgi:putative transposase
MPYIKLWIHLIWSTKNRLPIIREEFKHDLLSHIKDNAKNHSIVIDFINCTEDHIHMLVSLSNTQNIAKVVNLLKGESSHWMNENYKMKNRFEWQDEYIAVSISESTVNKVRDYIKNQEEHHRKKTFIEEYKDFLVKYNFEDITE